MSTNAIPPTNTALMEEIREKTDMAGSTRDDFLEHVIALKQLLEECTSYVHYLLPGVDDIYTKLSAEIKEDLFDRLQQFDELIRTVESCGRHKLSEMYFADRDAS